MTQIAQNSPYGRWAVAAMFFTNGSLMGAWAPQIPLLLPRHQIGEATMGLLILGLGLGAVGAMLFGGRLIARFGVRRVLGSFALALLPILPLIALAPNLYTLAIAMAAFGAFGGSMDVAMNANAVTVERNLGRAIMSSSHGFWSLGGFIGGALGGWLIGQFGPVLQATLMAGLGLVVVLAALPHLAHDEDHSAKSGDAPHVSLIPRQPIVWLLGLMSMLCMVPEGAVLDWSALYLTKELSSDAATAGLAFGLFSAAMALMRFLGDAVRNRFGAVKTLRISALIAAGGIMMAATAPTAPLVIAALGFAGLGVANMVPILFSAAGNLPGLTPGAGIAGVTMFGYSGILVAPSAIGFVAEHVGFRITYAAVALLLILVVALAQKAAVADGVGQAGR